MAIVAEVLRRKLLEQLEDNNEQFCVLKSNPYKIGHCSFKDCDNCIFQPKKDSNESCYSNQMKWMLSECDNPPVELTKFEYALLSHVYKLNYKYIARDKNDDISLYLDEPDKDLLTEFWHGKEYEFTLFNKLFSFIKWGDNKPVEIKHLLEHCEVLENGFNR